MKKWMSILLFAVMLASSLTACKNAEDVDENRIFQINYISNEENRVVTQKYVMQADLTDADAQIEEILSALGTTPKRLEYKPPLAQGFSVLNYDLNEGNLILNMDDKYLELSVPLEVLTRAALVRSFTQIEGVNYVGITVSGMPLMDNLGNPLGMMTADTFVDNAGSQINSVEQTRIRLYFADKNGTGLVAVNRTLVYSTNISQERLVVEQLIQGPTEMAKGAYPTMNSGTKVLGVTVKDGICYVNFDESFLNQPYSVSAEAVIYSIVNSLAELSNVNKVQILINGENDVMYRETMNLATVYERNLDLVVNPE